MSANAKPAEMCWSPTDRNARDESKSGHRVVSLLREAEDMAIVSSFLMADNEVEDSIIDASKRGVRCYIMLAAETRLQQEIGNEFDQKAFERSKATLKRLAGMTMVRTSEKFHAKMVLADPRSDNPRGMLLTANLTFEGLNRNQELFVILEPGEVRESFAVMRHIFWERSSHELVAGRNQGRQSGHRLQYCQPLAEIPRPKSQIILQGGSNPQLRRRILQVLDGKPGSVTVASFGWDAERPVVDRLCGLAMQGADVSVLTRIERKSTTGALARMRSAGVTVLGFPYLHAKCVITDTDVVVMSANIEKRGLNDGFELGISLSGKRAAYIRGKIRRWKKSSPYKFDIRSVNQVPPPKSVK